MEINLEMTIKALHVSSVCPLINIVHGSNIILQAAPVQKILPRSEDQKVGIFSEVSNTHVEISLRLGFSLI